MSEICQGRDQRQVVQLLIDEGWLPPHDKEGRSAHSVSVPGFKQSRFYIFTSDTLSAPIAKPSSVCGVGSVLQKKSSETKSKHKNTTNTSLSLPIEHTSRDQSGEET